MTREQLEQLIAEEATEFTRRTGIQLLTEARTLMLTKASPYLPSTHQAPDVRAAIRATLDRAQTMRPLTESQRSSLDARNVQASMDRECKFLGWC